MKEFSPHPYLGTNRSMGDKSVETLGSKFRFSSVLETFPSSFPQTMLIFLFLRQHRPQRLHNSELAGGGIRELTLDANKTEQVLQYREESFSKNVLTTFVAHWLWVCLIVKRHAKLSPWLVNSNNAANICFLFSLRLNSWKVALFMFDSQMQGEQKNFLLQR